MNQKQKKETITFMRRAGKTYREIGQSLGMKESTIRTFCCRNGLTDRDLRAEAKAAPPGCCPHCGEIIVQIPKQKPKKFCSERCRLDWWAEHKILSEEKAFYHLLCKGCGKEFVSYGNKGRKYCSRECYFRSRSHADAES